MRMDVILGGIVLTVLVYWALWALGGQDDD